MTSVEWYTYQCLTILLSGNNFAHQLRGGELCTHSCLVQMAQSHLNSAFSSVAFHREHKAGFKWPYFLHPMKSHGEQKAGFKLLRTILTQLLAP